MQIEELLDFARQLLHERKVAEALRLFTQAEEQGADPDECGGGRWECNMLLGHFEAAWAESDAITARGKPDPLRYWDGSDWKDKRVLVRCLHGLGDTIQFARFLPVIRSRAKQVILESSPPLKRLLQQSELADTVLTWGEVEPPWDMQVEVNELPRMLRVNEDSAQSGEPYLRSGRRQWKNNRCVHAGLVWASSGFNPARSIPVQQLDNLLEVSGVEWHGLQAGQQHTDAMRWKDRLVQHCSAAPDGTELAELTNSLDLLITVDTMNAHLGGALGVQTWTLLPFAADWRWMLSRDDTPWYPTMTLLRQSEPDAWKPVIDRVKQKLKGLVRQKLLEE